MHARVVTNQIKPGKMEEWLSLARSSIVPALQNLNGFKGFVALTDPANNKSIGYSVWESEAALLEGERDGSYQQQIAKLGGVLAAPPTRELFQFHVLADWR